MFVQQKYYLLVKPDFTNSLLSILDVMNYLLVKLNIQLITSFIYKIILLFSLYDPKIFFIILIYYLSGK